MLMQSRWRPNIPILIVPNHLHAVVDDHIGCLVRRDQMFLEATPVRLVTVPVGSQDAVTQSNGKDTGIHQCVHDVDIEISVPAVPVIAVFVVVIVFGGSKASTPRTIHSFVV